MIKRLAKCVGEYKKSSILAPVYVTIEVIMEIIIPLLMAQIIDYGIAGGNMGYILRIGIALILAAFISLFFGMLAGKYAAIASAGFAKNVRREMYHNIQSYSFANIDRFSPASLITRLTTDVTNVQNAFQMIIRILARAPIMLILSLIMSFSINKTLSLVFLVATPILGLGLYLIMTNAHPIFEWIFRTYDRLNNLVAENLRGIRVVKSYVREEHETQKFKSVSADIYRNFSRAEKILAFNSPLMQFVMYACTLLLAWFGAQMIVADTLTTGQLMSLLSYTMQILMSLMVLSMVFVMITLSKASARRIIEVLNEKSDLQNAENPVMAIPDGSVSFHHVSFSYSKKTDKPVLQNIDFAVKAGETVGIIGGTGSAKTTLMQLIPRLYEVDSGSVTVGGIDVREYDLQALRDGVAMVLQKNELFSGTIKDNLRWGNQHATDEELVKACRLAQADGFIRSLPHGYDTYIEQGGSNVSGGQKQRLCIARALLKQPKILILDDSTSAVDMKTDALIRRAFKEEIAATTKFIIAQRLSSVEDADKIIVLDGGKINSIGPHEELLQHNAIYQEIYNSQMKRGGFHDVK